jgi:hypothetical protein
MKPAFSALHGGRSASAMSAQALPARLTSRESLRPSAIRPSRRQEPFASGSAHIDPSSRCHATAHEPIDAGRAACGRSCDLTFHDFYTCDGHKAKVTGACGTLLKLCEPFHALDGEFLDETFVARHVGAPDRDNSSYLRAIRAFQPGEDALRAHQPVPSRLLTVIEVRRQLRPLTLDLTFRFVMSMCLQLLQPTEPSSLRCGQGGAGEPGLAGQGEESPLHRGGRACFTLLLLLVMACQRVQPGRVRPGYGALCGVRG